MKRILNDGSSAAGHHAQTSQSEDGPSPRRARLSSALMPLPEGMPIDHRRAPTPGTLAPRTAVLPARLGLPDLPSRGAAPLNEAEIDEMIYELLEQPGELHFATQDFTAQTQPPDVGAALQSRVQMIGSGPDTPAPYPPALLLQANEQDIEAAITVMRRDGLTREVAEHATGLRAGVLAAVVDVQGRWLDDQAQSDAVAALPPAQLQAFSMMLHRVRGNLQRERAPVPATTAAAPPSGQTIQEHEVYAMVVEDILTQMPRRPGEPAAAAARRIYRTNKQVQALPYEARIAVLVSVTGAQTNDLRAEPALRDTDPQTAQRAHYIRTRVPRKEREGPTAWARRIYAADAQVQALPYEDRISMLAVVTDAREDTLRSQPALRDMSGPMAQLAQDIRMRVPQQAYRENRKDWARRIYETDVQVRELPYAQRISVLAMVTGAREADLRTDPALRDMSGPMAQQVHEIRMRMPQQDRETPLRWAQRIYETDAQVQSLPYPHRISVLAMVTRVRESRLRANPALEADGDSAGHPHADPSART